MKYLLSFLFIALSINSYGQDTLVFLSGKTKTGYFVEKDLSYVYYRKKNRETGKVHSIDATRMFYVRLENGQEEMVYKHDTIVENDFTEAEMRRYVEGVQQAKELYHPYDSFYIGFGVGFGGAFLGHFWGIIPAAGISYAYGAITPSEARFKVKNELDLNDDFFLEGYQTKARQKRFRNAAISSLTGLVAGLFSWQAILKE